MSINMFFSYLKVEGERRNYKVIFNINLYAQEGNRMSESEIKSRLF